MRELLKKIIITTMAVLIALANVVTTMADDFNGAGTGDYTGDSTYEQVAVLSYYHYNQGFRSYLVNEKGVPVSGLVDFVKYRPWDIEVLKTAGAADTNEDIDLMWEPFFNRTGIWSNPGGEKYKNIKYIGGAKTDKWRVSTNDNALGKVYKDGTNPDGVGVCSIKRERFDGEESMEELKIEEAKMYTLADLYYALKVNIEADGYVFPFNGTHTKGSYQFRGNTYEVYNYMPAAIESINSSLSLTGTALKNMLMRPLNIEKYEADQSLVVQYLVDLYMVETDGLGRVKGGNYVPLFDIQDQAIKVYYNEVNEKYLSLSEEEKKETLNPMRDTMNHFNLKVAFEPLTWQVPTVSCNLPPIIKNKWGYYWTDDKIVYGTVSNIVQYVQEQVNKWTRIYYKDCPSSSTDYISWLNWMETNKYGIGWAWGYPQKAYHLEREMYGLKPYIEANQSLASMSDTWNKIGYGVMYFGTQLDEVGAITSTYDKAVTGEAPSPENTNSDGTFPSKYPSEGKEYADKGKDHSRNIVKFYCEKQTDGTYVYFENHVRKNTVSNILIEDEGEYKVDGYFTSPEYKAPENENSSYDEWKSLLPKGEFSGSKAEQIKMSADSADTTLYMRLTKISVDKPEIPDTKNLVLHENELAKVFSLSDLNNLVTITHEFTDHYKSGSGSHGDDEDSWNCDWETVLDNSSYLYELKNSTNYENTTFIGSIGLFAPVEKGTVVDTGEADINGTVSVGLTPNLKFSIYRDSAKDNVTLYPNKNSQSVIDELGQIGITSQSYVAGNKRIEHEGNGEWTSTFSTSYEYSKKSDKLYFDSSCGSHGSSGSYNGTAMIGLDVLNKAFSQSDNILSKYELGRKNIGTEEPIENSNAFTIFGKTFASQRLTKVNKGKDIEFFPYISMVYEGTDEITKEAKVVSENISKLGNIQLIDTGVYFGNGKPTLNISSEQWSTHVRAIEGLKLNGVKPEELNNSLLPGGATFDLKSANSSSEAPEVWVGVKTYQVTVPDENMEKLSKVEGVSSTSQGKTLADNMINQLRKTIDHYQIVQWVDNGIYTDEIPFRNSGSKVLISGQKAANSYNGKSLSTDRKYYLKVDGEGANRADMDILREETEQHIWRIQNDNTGLVWISKDGAEIARTEIGASKDISGLLVSEELKNLEEKTKLFSNYVKALDIKLGADRNSQPWYTEAFDGVEVVETSYAAQVGFGGSTPIRSSVLDPLLTGKLESKSDILNLTKETIKEKARTMQFRTSYKSTTAEAQSKENGWVADLNGSPVIIRGMDNVLRSKLFYTGNSTVMDLN